MLKGNLLIVDDEPLLLEKLRMNLEDYADKVFVANNGEEAHEILLKEKIHCVICDVKMPKMNGIELIQKIREEKNTVPFIFFTGHGNHEMILEVAKYGAFEFFDKPNMDGLDEVIQRGLKLGLKESSADEEKVFVSDYHKLLSKLEKNEN